MKARKEVERTSWTTLYSVSLEEEPRSHPVNCCYTRRAPETPPGE